VALFLTGFVSLALEVFWMRAFTRVLGTTIYAFASILAVYLAANAVGAAVYRAYFHSRRSILARLYGLLPVSALLPVYFNDPRWSESPGIVWLSLIPFCFLVGILTAQAVDAFSHGDPRRAGEAYAVNIAGGVLGPLMAGYLWLSHAGAKEGQLAMALLLVPLGALVVRSLRWKLFFVFVSCTAVGWGIRLESPEHPSARFGPSVIRRDYTATVVSLGQGLDKRLFVNGVGITYMTPLTKMMAHLPVLAHAGRPREALVICFGMGTTFRSLMAWDLGVTAVELVPSVRDAFGYYFADADSVLARPTGRVVIDDGRRFLKRTAQSFDIVTIDPPPPIEAAASGLLYSREFYALLKTRLNSGAVVQQWWPGGEKKIVQSVARTFAEAFPYVRVYKGLGGYGFHFLGSDQPLAPLGIDSALRRMGPSVREDFLEWNPGWALKPLWTPVIAKEVPIESLIDPCIPVLTDNRPFNEYYALRRWQDRRAGRYETIE
jgi:hypothetical protein